MNSNVIKSFSDNKKYILIVSSFILLLFASWILKSIIVNSQKTNWKTDSANEITQIEKSIKYNFKFKKKKLLQIKNQIKKGLIEALKPQNRSFIELTKLINNKKYNDYSIEVLAPNKTLIAWNKNETIQSYHIFQSKFKMGHIHFYDSKLFTYFFISDTLLVDNEQFYFVVLEPIQKKYKLDSDYYIPLNYADDLSKKYKEEVKIFFSPFAEAELNNDRYSFNLENNFNEKIALVTFSKPLIDAKLILTNNIFDIIQSTLLLLIYLFLPLLFLDFYKKIKSGFTTLLLIIAYIIILRWLLFYIQIPFDFLFPNIAKPIYFSSKFGGGIVKSPYELFVTLVLGLLICFKTFRYFINLFQKENNFLNKKHINYFILPFSAIVFFILLRSFNASIKSVIFDSSIRYFKESNLLPNIPSLLMNLNVLLLGISFIFLLIVLIIPFVSFIKSKFTPKESIIYLITFLLFQFFGFLFVNFQPHPLATPFLYFVIISIIFMIVIKIIHFNSQRKSIYNYFFIALGASIIVVSLMNFFNKELEKESIKLTAIEINRSNDDLFKFLLSEVLLDSANDGIVKSSFLNYDVNFNSLAFQIWSKSSLQKESLPSAIIIYNKNKIEVGRFNLGLDKEAVLSNDKIVDSISSPIFYKTSNYNDPTLYTLTGQIPIKLNGEIVGYLSSSIKFNIEYLVNKKTPEFLFSKNNLFNSVINLDNFKIFIFDNSKLIRVYGDIYPSLDQIRPILSSKLSKENDGWINLNFNNENYFTYILKNSTKITAISVLEKNFSWSLFNFFKLFIIQSVFTLSLLLILFLYNYKKVSFTFGTQLQVAFIVISVIPIILLAVLNRNIVEEKSLVAITRELSERSKYVENNIDAQLEANNSKQLSEIFNNAGNELDISFSIFKNGYQIFSSKQQFNDVGLFRNKLNPLAYYYLDYLNYSKYLVEDKLDNYKYHTFYKKVTLKNDSYIIAVNSAFNKIHISYSVLDADIFLFGIYSFAVILIIIISSFFAKKISSPIRKLTLATKSLGEGNLDINLALNQKGEIKELYDGFNRMAKELQKNQIEMTELERENAWKEMAKQVAHEIKNPLTPMKLSMQQLVLAYNEKKKNFNELFSKLSETILGQIENLNLISTEFSNFARMPLLKLEELDIIKIITQTSNLFNDENLKINIITELKSAVVEIDKNQFKRMLINFIRNSIQANSNIVNISVFEEDENYCLMIADNGEGIKTENMGMIFNPDFTTKKKGSGIGLYLAKRFIENINGKLYLEKSSVNGTVFKIILPIRKDKNSDNV